MSISDWSADVCSSDLRSCADRRTHRSREVLTGVPTTRPQGAGVPETSRHHIATFVHGKIPAQARDHGGSRGGPPSGHRGNRRRRLATLGDHVRYVVRLEAPVRRESDAAYGQDRLRRDRHHSDLPGWLVESDGLVATHMDADAMALVPTAEDNVAHDRVARADGGALLPRRRSNGGYVDLRDTPGRLQELRAAAVLIGSDTEGRERCGDHADSRVRDHLEGSRVVPTDNGRPRDHAAGAIPELPQLAGQPSLLQLPRCRRGELSCRHL